MNHENDFGFRRLLCGALLLTITFAGCSPSSEYPQRPITLICPWAAGGGTDRCSRQIAAHLEHELGVPVSVVNATGGKGVTGHSRGLHARPDGSTLLMATLELNMLHWSGLTQLTYDDCIPLMSINEDYAALFVRKDAPWETVAQLEADIAANRQSLKASGTASGGAWHLALAGWLLAAQLNADDVVWISSTGANPSLQELMSGGVDMVCCSLPEAATLFEAGEIRALGVMSPQTVPGYEQVSTFAGQGRDWSLGGWRGIVVPLGTPPHIIDRLEMALQRIVTGQTSIVSRSKSHENTPSQQTFPEFMQAAGFDHTARPHEEFRSFLAETDDKFGVLLTSEAMRSVNRDQYNALTWPRTLMGIAGLLAVMIVVREWQRQSGEVVEGPQIADRGVETSSETLPIRNTGSIGNTGTLPPDHSTTSPRWDNFALVVAVIILYLTISEVVGFVPLAFCLLFTMLLKLGTRVWVSSVVTAIFVPLAWWAFAGLLRIPLPYGLWGG